MMCTFTWIKSASSIKIIISELNSFQKWENTFSEDEIEELTKKVGNFKTFERFIEMFESSLKNNNDRLSYKVHSLKEIMIMKNGDVNQIENNLSIFNQTVFSLKKNQDILS